MGQNVRTAEFLSKALKPLVFDQVAGKAGHDIPQGISGYAGPCVAASEMQDAMVLCTFKGAHARGGGGGGGGHHELRPVVGHGDAQRDLVEANAAVICDEAQIAGHCHAAPPRRARACEAAMQQSPREAAKNQLISGCWNSMADVSLCSRSEQTRPKI